MQHNTSDHSIVCNATPVTAVLYATQHHMGNINKNFNWQQPYIPTLIMHTQGAMYGDEILDIP